MYKQVHRHRAALRIVDAVILIVDATSITLEWTAVEGVTRFKLMYTVNNADFVTVPPPPGTGTCALAGGTL